MLYESLGVFTPGESVENSLTLTAEIHAYFTISRNKYRCTIDQELTEPKPV